MLPVEILPVQETIVLRARGSELLILPNHVKKLKGFVKARDFSQYFRAEALVNRPARKLFEAWLRKDHTLWPRLYQTVHKEMELTAGDDAGAELAAAPVDAHKSPAPAGKAADSDVEAEDGPKAKKAAKPRAAKDDDEAPKAKKADKKDKDAAGDPPLKAAKKDKKPAEEAKAKPKDKAKKDAKPDDKPDAKSDKKAKAGGKKKG